MLVGRELQQSEGMPPQQCFIMPLLPGTDGTKKMSKSLGNYIGIDEPPNDIFGKVMSIPDTLIIPYYEWLTDTPTSEIEEIKLGLSNDSRNPMELKKKVAKTLVENYHDTESSIAASGFFERTVQGRGIPEEIIEFRIPVGNEAKEIRLSNIMSGSGLTKSAGEARRLINQGAVRLDETPVTENVEAHALRPGILRVGKRRYLRLL